MVWSQSEPVEFEFYREISVLERGMWANIFTTMAAPHGVMGDQQRTSEPAVQGGGHQNRVPGDFFLPPIYRIV